MAIHDLAADRRNCCSGEARPTWNRDARPLDLQLVGDERAATERTACVGELHDAGPSKALGGVEKVIIGRQNTNDTSSGVEVKVLEAFQHEGFSLDNMLDDVALVHLAQATTMLRTQLITVAQWSAIAKTGLSATVVGWGATAEGNDMTLTPNQVAVPLTSHSSCVTAYTAEGILRERESLALLDMETETISPWRTFAGLRQARAQETWIYVQDAGGHGVVRGDLEGDVVRCPAGLLLAGVSGTRALFTDRGGRKLIDLVARVEVANGAGTTRWQAVHGGLFLGVRERTREIVALRSSDGTTAWSATPFASKVDSIGHPCGRGDEVHVRARTARGGCVARLAVSDGAVRGLRDAPITLDSWLPDLGANVDRALEPFRASHSFAEGDALVLPQSNQAIVVRASSTARVALPALAQVAHAAGRIAGDLLRPREDRARHCAAPRERRARPRPCPEGRVGRSRGPGYGVVREWKRHHRAAPDVRESDAPRRERASSKGGRSCPPRRCDGQAGRCGEGRALVGRGRACRA